MHGRRRNGQRQRARVIGPCQHEFAAFGNAQLIHRVPVRERLAGMVHGGFHVHERLVAQIGHHLELRFGEIRSEIATFRKQANSDGIAIRGEHWHCFTDMLCSSAVHDRARTRLHLPGALSRRDDDRGTAEPHHRALKRGECAQRWIQEQKSQHLARKRLRLRMLLQTRSKPEQILHMLAREIGQI